MPYNAETLRNVPPRVGGGGLALHATATLASKGRLIRCTVPTATLNRAAIFRTPSVRPGLFRASRIRSSSSEAIGGRKRCQKPAFCLMSRGALTGHARASQPPVAL
jgi:hypothetical protein